MRTVIVDSGITACINAGLNGPKVAVTKVKVGSSIISPDSSMTDVTNVVWEGDSSYIQYQLIDERTFLFKVTLDESIGDFDIGNIGLFLDDGTMFCVSTLIGVEKKVANNAPVVGNRKIFEIPIVLAGISGAIDVTLLVPDEASLPFVQTEASLPNYVTAPFSAYIVTYHTRFKTSALAMRTSEGWSYSVANMGDDTGTFEEGMFDPSVAKGDLVYFDSISGVFKKANGLDSSKGYIGIRGAGNNLISTGTFTNDSWNLTPGVRYYAGQNGLLTSTPNNYFVGIAITTVTIALKVESETINNKVQNVNKTNPSTFRYPSEAALVDFMNSTFEEVDLPHSYAKIDMSNVGDVTFTGTVTFENIIQGRANRANWGDLAEYYIADESYPAGTLVMFGGKKEITAAKNEKVNAVVTSKPAYLMNGEIADLENATAIALTGRVPVRVVGKVKKFDEITVSELEGIGMVSQDAYDKIIGIALEDKDEYDEGLVLCSVRLSF